MPIYSGKPLDVNVKSTMNFLMNLGNVLKENDKKKKNERKHITMNRKITTNKKPRERQIIETYRMTKSGRVRFSVLIYGPLQEK